MILLLFSPAGVRAVCAGEHSGSLGHMMNSTRPSLTLSQGPSQTPLCVTPCRQTPAERVPGQRYGFAPAGLPSLQQPGWEAKAGPRRVISLLETQTLQNGVQSSSQEAGESQVRQRSPCQHDGGMGGGLAGRMRERWSPQMKRG